MKVDSPPHVRLERCDFDVDVVASGQVVVRRKVFDCFQVFVELRQVFHFLLQLRHRNALDDLLELQNFLFHPRSDFAFDIFEIFVDLAKQFVHFVDVEKLRAGESEKGEKFQNSSDRSHGRGKNGFSKILLKYFLEK